MDAVQALRELGGIADARTLVAWSSRRKVRTALRTRRIVRIARGRYALPDVETGTAAARLHGVVSHLSAALHWGWAVKAPPARPHVAVPRGRKVDPRSARGVHVHHLRLAEGDTRGAATSPLRTLIDCARDLPFDHALAAADSALREETVTKAGFVRAASLVRGPGARAVRRVAEHADHRAANPFESALRAAAIERGLEVTVQHPIRIGGVEVHPDVVDVSRRLVIEADSWRHHAGKEEHDRDCWRYTMLVTARWHVLRFTWDHVMHRPDFVREVLRIWAAAQSCDWTPARS